jgi:hypothetical protein
MKTICPLSKKTVDEHASQLVGAFVLFLLIGSYFTSDYILYFLLLDFLIRSINARFSPLARLARFILDKLHIPPKPIGAAPKRFAARLGLLFSIILLALLYINCLIGYQIVFVLFTIAVGLEAIFKFCIGCKIYTILSYLGLTGKN